MKTFGLMNVFLFGFIYVYNAPRMYYFFQPNGFEKDVTIVVYRIW